MAGNIRGRLDCLTAAGGASTTYQGARNIQAIFTTIWNFLDAMATAGRITRIASNYGNAASPTWVAPPTNTRGIGYWDESVNFGYDAFGVWRFDNALHPWYLFIELCPWQANTLPSSSLVQGGTSVGYAAIGISAAWGLDGSNNVASPWVGGTANAGADARANGSNVRWADPGGGVWVLPRSNNLYGNATTNKNDSTRLVAFNGGPTSVGFNIWADDDSFLIAYDANNSNAWTVSGVSRFTPRSGLTYPRPYMMECLADSTNYAPWLTSAVGNITATSDYGGIIMPTGHTGSPVRPVLIDRYAFQSSTTYQPSNVSGSLLYDEFGVKLLTNETTTTNSYGLCGELDTNFIREAYNIVSASTNSDLTRIYLGNTTTATVKMSLKWDGSTTPRTYAGADDAAKRVGVQGTNTATVL